MTKEQCKNLAKEVARFQKEAEEARALLGVARRRVVELERELDDSCMLRGIERMAGVPLEDRERVMLEVQEAFSGLSENHPVWIAFNKLLAIRIATEHQNLRNPTLTNDGRNMHLGRECGLEDFRAAIWGIMKKTRGK